MGPRAVLTRTAVGFIRRSVARSKVWCVRAIDALTRCRVIAGYGIGVDIVDVDAATRRGIQVTNAPNDWCGEEVADRVAASCRQILRAAASQSATAWGTDPRVLGQDTCRPTVACCWTFSGVIPHCPSATTRRRRPDASSNRSCRPGSGIWFLWRSTRRARRVRLPASPCLNCGRTCCPKASSCPPSHEAEPLSTPRSAEGAAHGR
ncbi:hypothetical protein ACH419_11170 [Streptomyces bobili]|uniref:hypothetical protein n=1 Tax=Streptomyces bobili TaxID=67280 RepID=UPI00379E7F91